VRLKGLRSGTLSARAPSFEPRRRSHAAATATTAMAPNGTATSGSRARLTTSTSTMTRTNITPQASRMPLASAGTAAA
jgi:hypothetical protein